MRWAWWSVWTEAPCCLLSSPVRLLTEANPCLQLVGLALLPAPVLPSALAVALLTAILLAARVAILPVGKLQLLVEHVVVLAAWRAGRSLRAPFLPARGRRWKLGVVGWMRWAWWSVWTEAPCCLLSSPVRLLTEANPCLQLVGLALLPAPVLPSALAVALLTAILLAARVAILPVGKLQLSDSSAVGDGRE